jgi:hypothetical protein
VLVRGGGGRVSRRIGRQFSPRATGIGSGACQFARYPLVRENAPPPVSARKRKRNQHKLPKLWFQKDDEGSGADSGVTVPVPAALPPVRTAPTIPVRHFVAVISPLAGRAQFASIRRTGKAGDALRGNRN